MKHIRLGSPYRKGHERHPREFRYPISSIFYLPKPEDSCEMSFLSVLHARSSRREWRPLSIHALSSLLWHVAKTHSTCKEESGFLWQHRSAPSGGGRHPVDLLVIRHIGKQTAVDLYDPCAHALARVSVLDKRRLNSLLRKVDKVLPFGEGTLIWLAGQFDRTMSKYARGECVVWLDAGALLATIYLVAEAIRLNCCAVGITGEPWVCDFLGSDGLVEGLCGCVVGARPGIDGI